MQRCRIWHYLILVLPFSAISLLSLSLLVVVSCPFSLGFLKRFAARHVINERREGRLKTRKLVPLDRISIFMASSVRRTKKLLPSRFFSREVRASWNRERFSETFKIHTVNPAIDETLLRIGKIPLG